jgi:hypothetical protein
MAGVIACAVSAAVAQEPEAIVDTRYDQDLAGSWVGRVDALVLWRNAPPGRPLIDNAAVGGEILNANGMDSEAAAGPRFTIMRVNNETGHAIEATYFRGANFRSRRPLATLAADYNLASPGIYGNGSNPLDNNFTFGDANLGSAIQSFEFNRHHALGRNVRFIAGFRWLEWQEQFTLATRNEPFDIDDFFQTGCTNSLYGGQIGLDAIIATVAGVRFDGLVKAGAYYNNAVQRSVYTTNDPFNPGTAAVAIGQSPASGAFAGEVGATAVFPVTQNIDIRLGYLALWLSGIAQPTQQLSGQQLTPGEPIAGSLGTDGGVVVQGVSVGLEGRF